jgi:hypothetical protein
VYGGIPFQSVLESFGAFETARGVRSWSESGSFGFVSGYTPTGRFRDLQRVVRTFLACAPLLGIEYLRQFSMSQMWVVLVGACVTVYSTTGVSVIGRDNTGVTDRQLRTQTQSYGWRSIGFFAGSRWQHLFDRGHNTTYLILDLNGLTFYQGSCLSAGLSVKGLD